jgi:cysteine desulfurase
MPSTRSQRVDAEPIRMPAFPDDGGYRVREARDLFVAEVLNLIPKAVLTVANEPCLPTHVHLRIPGVSAEVALINLDRLGVAASSGAACSSGSVEPSHVLIAAGLSEAEAAEGLRFTFGRDNTESEARGAAECLAEAVRAAKFR